MIGDKHVLTMHHPPAETQSAEHIGGREAIEFGVLGSKWPLTPREEVSDERKMRRVAVRTSGDPPKSTSFPHGAYQKRFGHVGDVDFGELDLDEGREG